MTRIIATVSTVAALLIAPSPALLAHFDLGDTPILGPVVDTAGSLLGNDDAGGGGGSGGGTDQGDQGGSSTTSAPDTTTSQPSTPIVTVPSTPLTDPVPIVVAPAAPAPVTAPVTTTPRTTPVASTAKSSSTPKSSGTARSTVSSTSTTRHVSSPAAATAPASTAMVTDSSVPLLTPAKAQTLKFGSPDTDAAPVAAHPWTTGATAPVDGGLVLVIGFGVVALLALGARGVWLRAARP